jgi:mannose-6-phosphate isomerase-like protein (cupin superfamily)
MKGYVGPITEETLSNENYRTVISTAPNMQLVLMTLQPGEDVGEEKHEGHDQFFRIEEGDAKIVMDGEEHEMHDDWAAIVPAGTKHNVINTSKTKKLKLYTIYAPPEHDPSTIHGTKDDACRAEKTGINK